MGGDIDNERRTSPLVYITESRPVTADARLLRYQMQSVARHMLPDYRIGICLRHQVQQYGEVDIYRHRETLKAFFGGLMVCGSVWVCPVCSSKISERRKTELRTAFDSHRQSGGHLSMLTLTFSHTRFDRLADLVERLGQAMQKFRRGWAFDQLRQRIGLIGSVRAFEITHGSNGWHPHIHLVQFHSTEIEPHERDELEAEYYRLWDAACRKVGLTTSEEHGLKLDDATEAATYIGKYGDLMETRWQIEAEMSKSNIKKGRKESVTPFDMLRLVLEDGDLHYEERYKEYASAMKGKTQLYWSRGLKQRFEITDRTDEQVAQAKEEPADLLGQLCWQEWRNVIKHDKRVEVLKVVEQHGYAAAVAYIKNDFQSDRLEALEKKFS